MTTTTPSAAPAEPSDKQIRAMAPQRESIFGQGWFYGYKAALAAAPASVAAAAHHPDCHCNACLDADGDALAAAQPPVAEVASKEAEPSEIWAVIDDAGQPCFSATWPEACHEHITDAISYHDLEEASKWVVRRYTRAALSGAKP